MRTLAHNPRLFLAGHRPGAPGSGLASIMDFLPRRRRKLLHDAGGMRK